MPEQRCGGKAGSTPCLRKHADDRIPDSIFKIIRRAAMEIGDARGRRILQRLCELRITLTQMSRGEPWEHHVRGILAVGAMRFISGAARRSSMARGKGRSQRDCVFANTLRIASNTWKFRLQAENPP